MSSEPGLSTEKLANDIIDACATGQLDQLKLLIPQYLDKPAPTMPTPQYLLQTAAENGRPEAIRLVFDTLPNKSQRPHHPWDPSIPAGVSFSHIPEKWEISENSIVFAALEGSDALSVFKLFFEYGMEPDYNLERASNTTACAISYGKVDLARFFLSRGAKLTGRYLQPEDTYLGAAARLPEPAMLKLLIEHGAKLERSQALRQAVQNGQVHNAKVLLELGVDVNEVYTRYNFPERKHEIWGSSLHWAVMGTPLERQERQASKAETVRFLLSSGAKVEVLDGAGRTPFQLAVEKGEHGVIDVFEEHGVKR